MNLTKQFFSALGWIVLGIIGFTGIAVGFDRLNKSHSNNFDSAPSIATAAQGEPSSPGVQMVVMIGNNSYIPLDVVVRDANEARIVLTSIELFEVFHPNLRVVHFHIDRNIQSPNYVRGVWLTHEPR